MAKIILSGVPELDRKLKLLAANMANKITRGALRTAGKQLLEKTKAAAPVDTGRLRKGLKLKALKRSRTRSGVMIQTPSREALGIKPGDKSYYPAAVEFGTDKKAANPFMRGTAQKEKPMVVAVFKREVAAGVQEATR